MDDQIIEVIRDAEKILNTNLHIEVLAGAIKGRLETSIPGSKVKITDIDSNGDGVHLMIQMPYSKYTVAYHRYLGLDFEMTEVEDSCHMID